MTCPRRTLFSTVAATVFGLLVALAAFDLEAQQHSLCYGVEPPFSTTERNRLGQSAIFRLIRGKSTIAERSLISNGRTVQYKLDWHSDGTVVLSCQLKDVAGHFHPCAGFVADGVAHTGNREVGVWRATKIGALCLQFARFADGREACWSIHGEGRQYVFSGFSTSCLIGPFVVGDIVKAPGKFLAPTVPRSAAAPTYSSADIPKVRDETYAWLMNWVVGSTMRSTPDAASGTKVEYLSKPRNKAIAVCVRWAQSTPKLLVPIVFGMSWGVQPLVQAREVAMQYCEKFRKGLDCTCTVVDENETNALVLPPDFVAKHFSR